MGLIRIVILFNNLPFGVICSAKTVLSTSLRQIYPAITMVNQKVFTRGVSTSSKNAGTSRRAPRSQCLRWT